MIKDLFVEGQQCPFGLDVGHPDFGWSFRSSQRRSVKQTAYRIIVSGTQEEVQDGTAGIWDSGEIRSARNMHIPYEGKPLESRKRYYWKVQVRDQDNVLSESAVSWWQMGLLRSSDWLAQWIGTPEIGPDADAGSIPLFRNEFTVDRPLAGAVLYICGLGHYELRLNGLKVGQRVLDPGWTHYDKSCLYAVHDVTGLLRQGQNALGAIVGNGFYNVTGGRYTKFKHSFGRPKCLIQLELSYTDGSKAFVTSSGEWMTACAPLTFSCMYGGEDYDARLEQDGWDLPGFIPGSKWRRAANAEAPAGVLKAQQIPPLKVMKTFHPVSIVPQRPHVYTIDFGQNFSGWAQIAVQGPRGASIRMLPSELLYPDGSADQRDSGSPYEFNYVLKGEGTEVWSPRFTYYGFRYLQIENIAVEGGQAADGLPVLISAEGQMIYPDIEASGSFMSSNPMLNKTHEIINWAILSNMKSVFTDCPHREKLCWLEQTHLMGPSLLYNYPVESLMLKVLEDIREAQLPSGLVPTTAPEYVVFDGKLSKYRHSVSWGAAYIMNCWNLFRTCGNTTVLTGHYTGMERYIRYLEANSEGFIIQDGLGDWYDIGENGPGYAQNTPIALPETAMFYQIVSVFARIAGELGREQDAERYRVLSQSIKNAYNRTFFNPATCQYATGSQTSNAMSLAIGLVEEQYRSRVLANLVADIHSLLNHTTAGDVGHRYVLLALASHGRSDIICEMAAQTDYPSYGYQIEHGATSLTEAWDGPTVGKSQNHFMLGHLEEWLYRGLGGLDYEFNSAAQTYDFTIKPYIDLELDHLEVTGRLPGGLARISWNLLGGRRIGLEISIPVNCTGTLYVPAVSLACVSESHAALEESRDIKVVAYKGGCAVLRVNSGTYYFESAV